MDQLDVGNFSIEVFSQMTLGCVKLTVESKTGQPPTVNCPEPSLDPAQALKEAGQISKVRTAQGACPFPVTVPVLCFSSKGTRRRRHPRRSQLKPYPGSPKIPCCLSGELWLVVPGPIPVCTSG